MSVQKWRLFIRQAVLRRVPDDDFAAYASILNEQHYLSGRKIARTLFDCRKVLCSATDPIVLRYVRSLMGRGATGGELISANDVLGTVVEEWCTIKGMAVEQGKNENGADATASAGGGIDGLATRLEADALVVQELAVQSASRQMTEAEARTCFLACAKLLPAIVPHVGKSNEGKEGDAVTLDPALSLVEAICLLFATTSAANAGVAVLMDQKDKEFQTDISQLFVTAAPFLPMMSLELRQRLEDVQKGFSLFSKSEDKGQEDTTDAPPPDPAQFEMNIMDADSLRSRASLYVYLNAALSGTPRLDDMTLMAFLMARYQGDFVNMCIHLILASFDVLANGIHRSESSQFMDLYHSFVSNKLPLLLSYISKSAIEHIPIDACITQAYSRIDQNVFPAFSSTFDLSTKDAPLADVRGEFLVACALHGLIAESSIEGLLGESSMMTLPAHGRYIKDNLAQQIVSTQKRAEQLIEELESFEGNSGAIAGAIVDVIQRLCRDGETMTLKRICLHIVRKPRRLDVITLFHSPVSFLQPLCNTLDGWKWDEDQGESQPVYDEFGSILLLVLTAKLRYSLSPSDLGITDPDSFVLRLLEQSTQETTLDKLDDTTKQHLGSWINSLFIAEGLSDELTSSCSPQAFYLLIPTLFSQSIAACNAGKLNIDTLRSGFEYLLEGFLLPSLLVALLWLSNHIRCEDSNLKSSLQLLHALIKPSSGSFESREIHQTIVSIASDPVKVSIQSSKNLSSSQDAQAIMKLLNSSDDFKRAQSVSRTEMDVWCSTPGGLPTTIQHAFQSLTFWDTNQLATSPPSFTFKLFALAVRIHGVVRLLKIFLDELKMQETSDLALDVLFAIVCAPTSSSPPNQNQVASSTSAGRLTLQDAVRIEHGNLGKYLETGDNITAEAIVRLNRRLDNLSMIVPPQPIDSSAVDAAAAAAAAAMNDDLASMDLTNINMDASAGGAGGGDINAALNGGVDGSGADSSKNAADGTNSNDPNANNSKDLLDQILESGAGQGGVDGSDGFGMGGDMSAMDSMFDLDSANLGLGDFDLDMTDW